MQDLISDFGQEGKFVISVTLPDPEPTKESYGLIGIFGIANSFAEAEIQAQKLAKKYAGVSFKIRPFGIFCEFGESVGQRLVSDDEKFNEFQARARKRQAEIEEKKNRLDELMAKQLKAEAVNDSPEALSHLIYIAQRNTTKIEALEKETEASLDLQVKHFAEIKQILARKPELKEAWKQQLKPFLYECGEGHVFTLLEEWFDKRF